MRIFLATTALMLIYALALASANPWDLAIGALLGLGLLRMFHEFLLPEPGASVAATVTRAIHLPKLIAATGADIVRGTVQVARIVLSPAPPNLSGFVEIPNDSRTETGVVVSGLLNTLSPGSVLISVDPDTESWTIHALDASDPEAVIEDAQDFYHRSQRPVWP